MLCQSAQKWTLVKTQGRIQRPELTPPFALQAKEQPQARMGADLHGGVGSPSGS